MKILSIALILIINASLALNAQNVNIPDANFKAALVADPTINTNGDSLIQITEAQSFTGMIYLPQEGIVDLTGIEAFTALTSLHCHENLLTTLDLSANTALTSLQCSNNELTSLNLSANTALVFVTCYYNQLTTLDLSANTALANLNCSNNQLSTLNLPANTVLTELFCSHNQLTSIDLSANPALMMLSINDNLLTTLNLSANTALEYLFCHNTQLTTLDLSQHTALAILNCSNNQIPILNLTTNTALAYLSCYNTSITALDLSTNTALVQLHCYDNQLITLNVANGNNINMPNISFQAQNNPNLICIEVDDIIYCDTTWMYIDSTTSFGINCLSSLVTHYIEKIDLTAFPNPTNGETKVLLKLNQPQLVQIQLFDIMGHELQNIQEYSLEKGEHELSLNTQDLSEGIYFCRVQIGKMQQTLKLVKTM